MSSFYMSCHLIFLYCQECRGLQYNAKFQKVKFSVQDIVHQSLESPLSATKLFQGNDCIDGGGDKCIQFMYPSL